MAEALFDPREGFYATKNPIGAGEDFITAPVISQMFGELMGLWAAQTWMDMGRPAPLQLIELGPGTGAMMADALRAGRAVPGFSNAVEVTLVEASAALKAVQGRTLTPSGVMARWTDRLQDAPPGPAVILGNEFLDCLPVRQAVKAGGVWRERMIGLHPEDARRFAFVIGPPLGADEGLVPARLKDAADGTLAELRPGDRQVVEALAARFAAHPGRALFIDYGPAQSEAGDTLQAIRGHEKADPLTAPGTADLTARVDFESLIAHARAAGLDAHGSVTQGAFLTRLGVEARAAALSAANPGKRAQIARQLYRLTDETQMGSLFKAVCLSSRGLPPPAGFDAHG
ncbi:MAG: SAM-dependent methyltransferase [Maricaulaceae bacterium]|nr:SAM-dependent methyltransferase [Maricaulaceae bacterium]